MLMPKTLGNLVAKLLRMPEARDISILTLMMFASVQQGVPHIPLNLGMRYTLTSLKFFFVNR